MAAADSRRPLRLLLCLLVLCLAFASSLVVGFDGVDFLPPSPPFHLLSNLTLYNVSANGTVDSDHRCSAHSIAVIYDRLYWTDALSLWPSPLLHRVALDSSRSYQPKLPPIDLRSGSSAFPALPYPLQAWFVRADMASTLHVLDGRNGVVVSVSEEGRWLAVTSAPSMGAEVDALWSFDVSPYGDLFYFTLRNCSCVLVVQRHWSAGGGGSASAAQAQWWPASLSVQGSVATSPNSTAARVINARTRSIDSVDPRDGRLLQSRPLPANLSGLPSALQVTSNGTLVWTMQARGWLSPLLCFLYPSDTLACWEGCDSSAFSLAIDRFDRFDRVSCLQAGDSARPQLLSFAAPGPEPIAPPSPPSNSSTFPALLSIYLNRPCGAFALSPPPQQLLYYLDVSGQISMIRVVDRRTSAELSPLDLNRTVVGTNLSFPLSLMHIRTSASGLIHLTDLSNQAVINIQPNGSFVSALFNLGTTGSLTSFDVSPDGRFIFLGYPIGPPNTVSVFDASGESGNRAISSFSTGGILSSVAIAGGSREEPDRLFVASADADFNHHPQIQLVEYSFPSTSRLSSTAPLPTPLWTVSSLQWLSDGVFALSAWYPLGANGDLLCFLSLQPLNATQSLLHCRPGYSRYFQMVGHDWMGHVVAVDSASQRVVSILHTPSFPAFNFSSSSSSTASSFPSSSFSSSSSSSSSSSVCPPSGGGGGDVDWPTWAVVVAVAVGVLSGVLMGALLTLLVMRVVAQQSQSRGGAEEGHSVILPQLRVPMLREGETVG